ncbi:hypothetical protein AAAC51_10950 [Priestia megaterium]
MPLHIGVVILVGAPILNPVVFAATFYAFQSNMSIVYSRIGLAAVACILIGLSVYFFFEIPTSYEMYTFMNMRTQK